MEDPRKLVSLVAIIFASIACFSGCANYGLDRFVEKDLPREEAALPGAMDYASVYLLRKVIWFPSMFPLPPSAYGVNDRVVSIMPEGSYVHLKLPAGSHTFSWLMPQQSIFGNVTIKRTNIRLGFEVGKTYFVGNQPAFGGPTFGLIDEKRGAELLKESIRAKTIYAPLTVDAFIERVEKRSSDSKQQKVTTAATNLQDYLPTQQQISNFFEVFAVVALVALLVVSAGAIAASSGPGVAALPATAPPQAYYSGVRQTAQVTKQGGETRIRDINSGVVYTLDASSITGSDGSRYRVSGNNIISQTGEYYQKIGNSIYGNDGSSCMITGTLLDCKVK